MEKPPLMNDRETIAQIAAHLAEVSRLLDEASLHEPDCAAVIGGHCGCAVSKIREAAERASAIASAFSIVD